MQFLFLFYYYFLLFLFLYFIFLGLGPAQPTWAGPGPASGPAGLNHSTHAACGTVKVNYNAKPRCQVN